jgi:hypothetical protein
MDTSRTPLSPGRGVKRRRTSPTNEYGIPSAHHSQQTSLPSFKQLEPYLRPPLSTEHPSSYPYSATSLYAPHTGQQQQQESATSSQIMAAPQRDSAIYGAGDSETDEVGHHSPPKKKRRRQALSCTGDYFTLLVWCPLPLTVFLFSYPYRFRSPLTCLFFVAADYDMLPLTW